MRGELDRQVEMFRYIDLESRITQQHPIRTIRSIVDEALLELKPTFVEMYSDLGRPSIAPKQLLRLTEKTGLKNYSLFAKPYAFQ